MAYVFRRPAVRRLRKRIVLPYPAAITGTLHTQTTGIGNASYPVPLQTRGFVEATARALGGYSFPSRSQVVVQGRGAPAYTTALIGRLTTVTHDLATYGILLVGSRDAVYSHLLSTITASSTNLGLNGAVGVHVFGRAAMTATTALTGRVGVVNHDSAPPSYGLSGRTQIEVHNRTPASYGVSGRVSTATKGNVSPGFIITGTGHVQANGRSPLIGLYALTGRTPVETSNRGAVTAQTALSSRLQVAVTLHGIGSVGLVILSGAGYACAHSRGSLGARRIYSGENKPLRVNRYGHTYYITDVLKFRR